MYESPLRRLTVRSIEFSIGKFTFKHTIILTRSCITHTLFIMILVHVERMSNCHLSERQVSVQD